MSELHNSSSLRRIFVIIRDVDPDPVGSASFCPIWIEIGIQGMQIRIRRIRIGINSKQIYLYFRINKLLVATLRYCNALQRLPQMYLFHFIQAFKNYIHLVRLSLQLLNFDKCFTINYFSSLSLQDDDKITKLLFYYGPFLLPTLLPPPPPPHPLIRESI